MDEFPTNASGATWWYITNEEFISVTLAIGNTYEDDVRGDDLGAGFSADVP